MPDGSRARLLNPVPDACYQLGVGRSTLYKLIGDGKIKAVKVGDRTLIPQDELNAYVDSVRAVGGAVA